MKQALLTLASAFALAGCATTAVDDRPGRSIPDAELHTIYISRFGDVVRIEDARRERNNIKRKTDCANQPSGRKEACEEQYARDIIENFVRLNSGREKPLTLTVHIHGGLNAFTDATSRSDRFTPEMLADGTYPVFFAWHSGAISNYWDHLWRVKKGQESKVFGPLTIPFVLAEDTTRSISRIPYSTYKVVNDPLVVMKSVYSDDERAFQTAVDLLRNERNVPDKKAINIHDDGPKVGVGNSYWTVLNPVKLVTAPAVDGFGTGIWKQLLRRTDLVLTKSKAFDGTRLKEQSTFPADSATTRFLKMWKEDKRVQHIQINLIGHSMGAIIATNVLARHPELNISNVVFMGGAARVKDVEAVVVPWLRQRPQNQFFNLSLDPYRELGENFFYDFAPRGSLLNWIDFIFGDVNSFKDRTIGSWWNVIRAADDIFVPQVRSQVHLVRFPIGGEKMGPQEHGDFSDYCFWQPRFWVGQPFLQLQKHDVAKSPHCSSAPAARSAEASQSEGNPSQTSEVTPPVAVSAAQADR